MREIHIDSISLDNTKTEKPPVDEKNDSNNNTKTLPKHSTSYHSSSNSESNLDSPKLLNSDTSTPSSIEEFTIKKVKNNLTGNKNIQIDNIRTFPMQQQNKRLSLSIDPIDISMLPFNKQNEIDNIDNKNKIKNNALIQTDSYIHGINDDSILLNKKVSRRSSKLRRSTQESVRTNIPFHASKHSQIVPIQSDKSNDLEYDKISSQKQHKLNLSISSLQLDEKNKQHKLITEQPSARQTYVSPNEINEQRRTTSNTSSSFRSSLDKINTGLKKSETATNEIKKMRESLLHRREMKRKRKAFLIDDDRVLIGNKVSEGHVNFIIAYNMLTGIRVAVSRCSGIMKPLTPVDFKFNKKLAFDYHGNELTPSSQYAFKFKDYSPEVFRELRALFGLDPADYLVSLTSKYILSELNSPGKSGSFFYYSRDYRYIIKTIHHTEHMHLRKHLNEYYSHIKKNPDTLLCQFYGLHRVKMPISFQNKIKHRKIYFVVMNNLFPPHLEIHKTFDLKGSTWGRLTVIDERKMEQDKTYRPVLKDLNWINSKERIEFGPLKKKKFLTQIQADIQLLSKLNIMDYSLLIGIHDIQNSEQFDDDDDDDGDNESKEVINGDGIEGNERYEGAIKDQHGVSSTTGDNKTHIVDSADVSVKKNESKQEVQFQHRLKEYGGSKIVSHFFKGCEGGVRASDRFNKDGRYIYYIGIIDCLTNYSIIKKLETIWRSLSHDRKLVSAIPPKDYGRRLYSFVEDSVGATSYEAYKDEPKIKNYKD